MIIDSGHFGASRAQERPQVVIIRGCAVVDSAELAGGMTGRQRQVRHRSALIAASALMFVLGIAYGLHSDEWLLAIYSLYPVGTVAVRSRPPTQVTAEGVRRPWRRRGFVPWTDVASVLAPQPGLFGMRLQLTNGKKVALDDIPGDQTAAVAAIGGKDVVQPARPSVPSFPPRLPRARTDADVLGDVTRQAAALARQREELAALSRRLAPPR